MGDEASKAAAGGPRRSVAYRLAVASVCLSFAGFVTLMVFFCVAPALAIGGIVCGHISLVLAKRDARPSETRGWAIKGLATGYVALAVLLFALLVPTLERPPRRSICTKNLQQIGFAMRLYATDYDRWYPIGPPETDSSYALGILAYGEEPYILDAGIFICPGSDDRLGAWQRTGAGYSAAGGGLRPSSTSYTYLPGYTAADHADTMLLFDDSPERHESGRNVLFIHGRAEHLNEEEFQKRLAEQEGFLKEKGG